MCECGEAGGSSAAPPAGAGHAELPAAWLPEDVRTDWATDGHWRVGAEDVTAGGTRLQPAPALRTCTKGSQAGREPWAPGGVSVLSLLWQAGLCRCSCSFVFCKYSDFT